MCGREATLIKADVESVNLMVCSACVKYGVKKTTERKLPAGQYYKASSKKEDIEFGIVVNYSSLIKSSREKRGMTQEEFAKHLNERESIVAKWESGLIKPRVDTARRLERILNIKLIEKEKDISFDELKTKKNDSLTLGDFIKIKKRKR